MIRPPPLRTNDPRHSWEESGAASSDLSGGHAVNLHGTDPLDLTVRHKGYDGVAWDTKLEMRFAHVVPALSKVMRRSLLRMMMTTENEGSGFTLERLANEMDDDATA